jgi:acyl transferase domain-containing protein/NADPH:quinone reductase-like Zn-dependent oxidoreductase/NADP-dependent 3-hydroxy acid dehydrogenase YdfG/aryl carrier-like protein
VVEIAIVGIGCRFPGGAASPEQFWQFLVNKGDGIVPVPADRWRIEDYYDPDPDAPGRMYTKHGGFLRESLWDFDPDFFGISAREASVMDPQQRLLLEVAWEALDDAGLAGRVAGQSVGVYVGGFTNDSVMSRVSDNARPFIGAHTPTSSSFTLLSNRISFALDLLGPSMTIDTACSSSLVAMHEATQAIARGECEMALVGGVTAMLQPETFISMCKGRFLSQDGRSKSFDASADGYGRGEGAGVVLLRPLADATRSRDRVYAVVRGTGSNQDGRTIAITVPNPESQANLATRVAAEAGIAPAAVGYVEAHGTGTAVGDPLEMEALGNAYGCVDERSTDLIVGSVKASIGHTEAAAGIAGVIKAALMVFHRTIAPQAWLDKLNPNIPFDDLRLRVPTDCEPFPAAYDKAIVAVNSFGYGGTNAHAILAEAPTADVRAERVEPLRLFPVSGRTEAAARAVAATLADALNPDADVDLLTEAAWTRRAHHVTRKAFAFTDRDDLLGQLREFAEGQGRAESRVAGADGSRPVFVFSGMGPQWWAMGRGLLAAEGPFSRKAAEIDEVFQRISGWSIIEELLRDESESRITQTQFAQPANFLVQVGLVAELAAAGVHPSAVAGHSVGEVSAAYVSGALSLQDALLVSYHRARLQATTEGTGGMLATGLSEADATGWLPADGSVSIAAINSPSAVTLAGPHAALDALAERLEAAGLFARKLRVQVPYHCQLMDPILAEITTELSAVSPVIPTLPLYSTVTSTRVTSAGWGGEYWRDNVRQPVRFADTVNAMVADGHSVFLEVGPHPVLSGNMREIFVRAGKVAAAVPTLNRDKEDARSVMDALAGLYAAGALDTSTCPGVPAASGTTPHVPLPAYPWQRQRLWVEPEVIRRHRLGSPDDYPLLGARTGSAVDEWQFELSVERLPWLNDHVVDGVVVLPGAAYLDAALSAAAARTGRADLALEAIQFRSPLIVAKHSVPVVQFTVEPSTRRFTIRSRNVDSELWTLNCTGRLVEAPVDAVKVDVSVLSDAVPVDGPDLYSALALRGLAYGKAFRCITRAQLGDAVVRADLDLTHLGDLGHVAHPAAVDAALQCVAVLAAQNPAGGAVIPAAVGTVRRYGPIPSDAAVLVRGRAEDALLVDIVIADQSGSVAMELGRVEFKPVKPAAPVTARLDGLFYEPVWELADDRDLTDAGREAALATSVVVCFGEQASPRIRAATTGVGNTTLVVMDDPMEHEAGGRVRDALLAAMGSAGADGVRLLAIASSEWTPEQNTFGVIAVARGAQLAEAAHNAAAPEGNSGDQPALLRGVIATENAFCLPGDAEGAAIAVAPLVGARRSLANEQPGLQWRLVDVGAGVSDEQIAAELVTSGVFASDIADEIALRHGARWLIRLRANLSEHLAARDEARPLVDPEASYLVEAPASKLLADLALRETGRVEPGPGQVEVKMEALSVNYKDPLKVIGLLTEKELAGTYFGTALGLEGAGTVVRVGPGVTEIAVGDKLGVGALNMMRRYITIDADAGNTSKVPSTRNAAHCSSTLPFLSAEYGLIELANTHADEVVLIHGAAGGMGLGAIQVAKALGAQVIATASTEERRAVAMAAGADHAIASRSVNFVDDVMALTGGRGVDVVYTSAPGEIGAQNFRVAAEFGRIVDIGKADIYGGGTLDLAPFDRNLSYFAVDMDRMLRHKPAVVRSLTRRVVDRLTEGTYQYLPYTSYPVSRITEAFEAAARSRHIGRVVLDFEAETQPLVRPQIPSFEVSPDAAYLVTGGFGAFGLATAKWLVAEGARHLVLLGRSGPTTDVARNHLAEFAAAGVDVVVETADVGDYEAVLAAIVRANQPDAPLRGIFHTAGLVDSRPIFEITPERLREVFRPKVVGSWNLHHAVEQTGVELDAFVLYSSVSALVGGAPQVSYSAANAALDALAATRHAMGKPAIALSWGAMGGGGMAESSEESIRYLALLGFSPVDMEAATLYLRECLVLGIPHAAVMKIDWSEWAMVNGPGTRNPRLVEHISAATAGKSGVTALQAEILALAEEERPAVLTHILAEQLAEVMGVSSDAIDPQTALPDLGLDSLMGVEFAARIARTLGVELSVLEFGRAAGLSAIGAHLAARLAEGALPTGPAVPTPITEPALPAEPAVPTPITEPALPAEPAVPTPIQEAAAL